MEQEVKTSLFCETCSKPFASRSGFKKHVNRIHLKIPNAIRCDTCGKMFANNWNLKLHVEMVHEKSTHTKCPICEKVLVSGDKYLLKHIEMHETEDLAKEEREKIFLKKNFDCQICGKLFACKESLKSHIRGVHEKSDQLLCHICHKTLSCKQYLRVESSFEDNS